MSEENDASPSTFFFFLEEKHQHFCSNPWPTAPLLSVVLKRTPKKVKDECRMTEGPDGGTQNMY